MCEKRVPEERGRGCKLFQRRLQNLGVLNSVFFLLFSQQLFWWEGRNWGWSTFLQEPLTLFWRTVTSMSWDNTQSSFSVLSAWFYHCANSCMTSMYQFKALIGFLIMIIKTVFIKSEPWCGWLVCFSGLAAVLPAHCFFSPSTFCTLSSLWFLFQLCQYCWCW